MSFALIIMVIAVLSMITGAALVGFLLGRHRLPRPSGQPQDRRLAEQAERIELLEAELSRVKEQADFTERLLSERGGSPLDDASGVGPSD
jgi:hypothetical protein